MFKKVLYIGILYIACIHSTIYDGLIYTISKMSHFWLLSCSLKNGWKPFTGLFLLQGFKPLPCSFYSRLKRSKFKGGEQFQPANSCPTVSLMSAVGQLEFTRDQIKELCFKTAWNTICKWALIQHIKYEVRFCRVHTENTNTHWAGG